MTGEDSFSSICPTSASSGEPSRGSPCWVGHRDLPNLSLLDAYQADVRDAVTLEVELKAYEQGTTAGGTGPSYIQRQRKKHSEQVKRAKQLGQDMFCPSQGGVGYKIDPKSKHRPRNNAATATIM